MKVAIIISRELREDVEAFFARLSPPPDDILEVFGFSLDNMPTEQEVRRAYGEMVKKYHPDGFFQFQDKEILEKTDYIFRIIRGAYERLDTMQKIIDYQEQAAAGAVKNAKSQRLQRDLQGIIAFDKAMGCLNYKDYRSAVEFFKIALDINPSDQDRMSYYAWALFKLSLQIKEDAARAVAEGRKIDNKEDFVEMQARSRDLLNQAVERNKKTASIAYLFLGHIYLSEGLIEMAETNYHLALARNPNLAEAIRVLRNIDIKRRQKEAEALEASKGMFVRWWNKLRKWLAAKKKKSPIFQVKNGK
ncbi:MAG: hypothetical protein WC310_02620 [Patescibacteria group bacterium]|jgi:tetratricopeptide (TPR) repeat protein